MSVSEIRSSEDYHLFCHGRLDNPFPLFHRLRSEDPVHWCEPLQSWLVTRYDDVFAGFLDPRLSAKRVPIYMGQIPEPVRTKVQPLAEHFSSWLGMTDPPDHTRLCTLIGKALTPKAIEGMGPRIQQLVDELLDEAETRGEMDLVGDFAYPLPATVICDMLGIPEGDHDRFKEHSRGIANFLGGAGPSLAGTAERSQHSLFEVVDYFNELIEERRRRPRNDLISSIAAVEDRGDRFSEREVVAMCIFLFFAGHETTMTLIGNGVLALFENPEQLEGFRQDPSLAPTAVEELLRYYSPLQRQTRVATRDMEIRGRKIQWGQAVLLLQGAANRDPEQFPDPDRLDLNRRPNKHMAFGWGTHFCLGAPLARLEGKIAFVTLLRRFPDLRISCAVENLERLENMTFYTLRSLPVVF